MGGSWEEAWRDENATHAACHVPRHLQVKIPKSISGEERKLMEQLRDLQTSRPAASSGRGWF